MNDAIFFNSFAFFCFSFKNHHHTDMSTGTTCHHIGYLKAGRARFVTDTEELEFNAGDVFFIPAGCKYRSYWQGDDAIVYDSYAFTYMPIDTLCSFELQRIDASGKAKSIIDELSSDKKVSLKSVGLLYSFLHEVMPRMKKADNDKKAEIVQKAKRFMHKHNSFSVSDVARHCHVSESAFYTIFKEVTGHTPTEEKHRIQAEKAAERLLTTDRSVEQISEELCFSSASYMRKIIRAQTGKTPKQIRARHDMQV